MMFLTSCSYSNFAINTNREVVRFKSVLPQYIGIFKPILMACFQNIWILFVFLKDYETNLCLTFPFPFNSYLFASISFPFETFEFPLFCCIQFRDALSLILFIAALNSSHFTISVLFFPCSIFEYLNKDVDTNACSLKSIIALYYLECIVLCFH